MLEVIDVKLLRWISEVIADGSVVRSLSGRSALLADGYSRNCRERDALLEQRTKDLQGLSGQARASDLDDFLSDWERVDGNIIPWALDPVPAAALQDGPVDVSTPSVSEGVLNTKP